MTCFAQLPAAQALDRVPIAFERGATDTHSVNLAGLLSHVGLPEPMRDWSFTSLQLKLIKIGARVVRHARAITSQLA